MQETGAETKQREGLEAVYGIENRPWADVTTDRRLGVS